jgi:hypothetical protein
VREFRDVVQKLSFELVQRPRKLEDKGVGLGRRVMLEGRHVLDPTIILEWPHALVRPSECGDKRRMIID